MPVIGNENPPKSGLGLNYYILIQTFPIVFKQEHALVLIFLRSRKCDFFPRLFSSRFANSAYVRSLVAYLNE